MKFLSTNFLQIENSTEVDAVIQRMMYALDISEESDLIKVLNVSRKTVSTWRHRGAVPLDQCDKIARTHDVSLDFLLYGKGFPRWQADDIADMLLLSTDKDESNLVLGARKPVSRCPDCVQFCEQFVMVPQYDIESNPCTPPADHHKTPMGYVCFRRDWIVQKKLSPESLCMFTVQGDSMMPTLENGELLLIDTRPVEVIRDSGIYMIGDDKGLRVKRLQRQTDGLLIISDNPIYKEEFVAVSMLDRLCIIGRAVWTGKTL